MTAARLTTLVVAMALVIAGPAAPASGGTAQRSTSTVAKKTCTKKRRARASCRRARVSAGLRRGSARGRARLAPPTTRPARPPAAGAGFTDPTAPAQSAPPAGSAPPLPGATDPLPVASTIGAEAYDFGSFVLRLTKPSVAAGQLTIYFRNYDVSEHNLWIEPPAAAGAPTQISAAVGEGGGATKTVVVSPGTWRLYCSLPGHEAMTRDLSVQ